MNSTPHDPSRLAAPDMYEIELTETQRLTDGNFTNNGTLTLQGSNRVVVRPEEALIVIFVLILWMGAIGLFVHRWGKIRNCEPYAPKFEAEHQRGSCHDLLNKRMSMSSKLVTQGPSLQATANQKSFTQAYPIYTRSRQNSVFVSPQHVTPSQPPRKTRSAMDLHSMLSEEGCEIV